MLNGFPSNPDMTELYYATNYKFTIGEVKAQLENMIDALKSCGFSNEDEKKEDPQNEAMAMEETMEEPAEAMEGGEETDFFYLKQYENDTEQYSGKGDIAKLLLRQTIVCPVFGDQLKKYLIEIEKDVIHNESYCYLDTELQEACSRINTLLAAYVKLNTATEPKEVWFTGIY